MIPADQTLPEPGQAKTGLRDIFGPVGGFAQIFPNFEVRSEQIQMAEAVAQALGKSQHLLVEAGTGIGKSLAYLVPAAEWALSGHGKVVVSTYTKLLQSQLIKKDIPLLKQALGGTLKAEPVFGQENYLCKRRVAATIHHGLFDSPAQATEIEAILEWADTSDGILVDFPGSIDPRTIGRIGRNSDNCLFLKCPYREECHYFRARERWQAADLLVINHHVYLANAGADDRMLPEFGVVVFDEAHRLEDVAARYYGIELSSLGLERLLNSVHNPRMRRGIMHNLTCTPDIRHHLNEALRVCRRAGDDFFAAVRGQLPSGVNRFRIRKPDLVPDSLRDPLTMVASALKELAVELDDEDMTGEIQSLINHCLRWQQGVAAILDLADRNAVYWAEVEPPDRTYLHSALIDVSEHFHTDVFEKRGAVILTSATLTVNREFRFSAERLGAHHARTLLLDSPFDFSSQALLFLDDSLPLPTEAGAFIPAAARRISEILHLSHGRALVLFTSYDALNRVYDLMPREEYRLLRQGDASTFELLEEFKRDVSSSLFATQSFWQGIDVPGEALSCLIITRLPFEVPDDPRLEGVAESLRDQGREPFNEYQLPQAVLRFRQGFGRLIRNKADRGVVCVLDKRILQRQYGRVFLNSLPRGVNVARNVNAIAQFLRFKPTSPQ